MPTLFSVSYLFRYFMLFLLMLFALLGDIGSVEDLIAEGVNPNVRGAQNRTPLHRAVGKGHNDVVSFLLDSGADTNLVDGGGLTPL